MPAPGDHREISDMSFLHQVDYDLVLRWLEELQIPHYLCGQCQGIHMTEVQSLDGVLESRVFLDQDCLIFSTELEVRTACLLDLQAELPRINGSYAHLKAFFDASDDQMLRLILCDTLWTSAGLGREQLDVFIQAAVSAKVEIIGELLKEGYFYRAEGSEGPAQGSHFH